MRSRFTMTSSYENYSCAGANEPDVGIPRHFEAHTSYISIMLGPSIAAQPYFGLSSEKTQLVRYRLRTSNCTGRATEAISGS
jgi:hypothetical protein